MSRQDFAFPLIVSTASGQVAQASYQDHVEQMIEQVLLTDPGERVCLPTFGAGLRRLLFAPISSQIEATTKIVVSQALSRWLGDQITVKNVTVQRGESSILIVVEYVLIDTQSIKKTQVRVF
jgi:phage baseplate assembly protein W